jgi:hypothetical protein
MSSINLDNIGYLDRLPEEAVMEHDDEFTLPLPPPPPGHDVVFFKRVLGPGEESDDILVRKLPADAARRFRAAAGGRALTHAQYLAALVQLHDAMRALADGGDERVRAELERLGLGTVTV